MHPVILQAFAAERIGDISAAVDTVQRARQARRARQHRNRGLIWARPAVRRAAGAAAFRSAGAAAPAEPEFFEMLV